MCARHGNQSCEHAPHNCTGQGQEVVVMEMNLKQ